MLFQPPNLTVKCFTIFTINIALLKKLRQLTEREHKDLANLPSTFMICYLNGFDDAKEKLIEAKPL
jgi:hypothetical protein